MKILRCDHPDFEQTLARLLDRAPFDSDAEAAAERIIEAVRKQGDAAVARFARKFDGVSLSPNQFRVSDDEIEAAEEVLPASARRAIRLAHRHIRDYARAHLPQPWSFTPRRGVVLGERFEPLDRVGAYVPGGTAPLVSTVLHTVTLAAAARVTEIVVTTPPRRDGSVHPAVLYAARVAGATEVYRLGGVYGVAALALGTPTVRRVEKIVGPGNAYVTAAKRRLYGTVALDLVAGPSEILIVADDTGDPRFIAADMLSQAEHGSGREMAVLVTTHEPLLQAVARELRSQSATLSRSAAVNKVLADGVWLILAESLEHAADIASRFAPEHLEIMTRRPGMLAKRIRAAGAVFIGPWTPEPVGDFVAGPSHVLPTGGSARFFSGLTVRDFFRRISVLRYEKNALERELDAITEFAVMEGLDAHGRSAAVRFTGRD